ncbi:MAG: DUF3043 domain-containing protein [Arcanobacterium sp.]|nr:DUF3043 domain-containing protein [Arcanobacterium sp.]
MFGSKKTKTLENNELLPEVNEHTPKGYTPPKGAPTPKRKDVEAKNRRPVVANRKNLSREEKREIRLENRRRSDEIYRKQQQAMRTGDEANMPYQHRGKVRSWGRDYIDASAPISAFFMPIALLILPLLFLQRYIPSVTVYITLGLYIIFFVMTLHAVYLARRTKNGAIAKFGAGEIPRGFTFQMFSRCYYPRRWRLPKAQVKRGEFPPGATKEDRIANREAARAAKKAAKEKQGF